MKKVFAILLALALVLSMSVAAFAANDGSITIENTTIGKTYTIYKVFDATYSGSNVSYTYTKTGDSDALYAALTGEGSPFTLTATSTANVYNVSSSDNSANISAFLKTNAAKLTQTATANATASTLKFSNLGYGYYYITSSLGSTVTIDSAVKDVTVVDKNEDGPTAPDKKADGADSNTASIGSKVPYTVTGNLARYNGETKIVSYTFTDTMSSGLTFNDDVVLKVGGNALTKDTDYTYTKNDNGFTIVLTTWTAEAGFKYAVDAAYEITYSANVNENAVIGTAGNTNSFELQYNNNPSTKLDDTTTTKVFEFALNKVDNSSNALTGAKFTLKKGDSTIEFTKNGNVYTVCAAGTAGAVTTIEAGSVTIKGLGAGTYTLTETEAPAGYNMLAAPLTVVINADGTFTLDGNSVTEVKVVNSTGSELPSTGGIGTTIFYVVGGLMVAVAIVLLVTKKKASSK